MVAAKKPVAATTVVLDCGFGPTMPNGDMYVRGTAEKGGSLWVALGDNAAIVLTVSILTVAANRGETGTATLGGSGFQVDGEGNPIPDSSAALTMKFIDQHVSVTGVINGKAVDEENLLHNAVGNPVRYI